MASAPKKPKRNISKNKSKSSQGSSSTSLYKWAAIGVIVLVVAYSVIIDSIDQGDCVVNGSRSCLDLVGVEQKMMGGGKDYEEAFLKTVAYMKDTVMVDDLYVNVRADCRMKDRHCIQKVLEGDCDNMVQWPYMDKYCAPACKRCEMLDPVIQCPKYDPQTMEPRALQKGGVHSLFEKLSQSTKYSPEILSQPESKENDDKPWVVVLNDFLSKEECETLIALGHESGFQKSYEYGT